MTKKRHLCILCYTLTFLKVCNCNAFLIYKLKCSCTKHLHWQEGDGIITGQVGLIKKLHTSKVLAEVFKKKRTCTRWMDHEKAE